MFSLGVHYPLQALVLSFLPLRYLSIIEPALGIAVTLLLVGILSADKRVLFSWRIAACAGLLLVACLAGSAVLANLAPAFLMVPPILLLVYAAMQGAAESGPADYCPSRKKPGFIIHAAILGALASYLASLRPTAIPFAGILLVIVLWQQAAVSSTTPAKYLFKAALAALLGAALFMLPFALDLHRSSGTYMYPILGRGNHATASAQAPAISSVVPLTEHLRNLMQQPLTDWLLILTAVGFGLSCRPQIMRDASRRRRLALIFVGMLISYSLIVYQTGGVAVHRYAAPMILGFAAYLITIGASSKLVGLPNSPPRLTRPILAASSVAVCFSLAFPIVIWRNIYTLVEPWIIGKIAVREQALFPSADEAQDYRCLQSATPAGTVILAALQRNNLFDLNHNLVLINDQPGMAAPPQGWPFGYGGNYLAGYLHRHGVQYVAVMRDAWEVPSVAILPSGWAGITTAASQRSYNDLRCWPLSNSRAYESPRLLLLRVPN